MLLQCQCIQLVLIILTYVFPAVILLCIYKYDVYGLAMFFCYNHRYYKAYNIYGYNQGRRLVINIGGQKFGSQILGGKNFLKIYFKKKIFKSSLQFSKKIPTTLFFSHRKFFSIKCTLKMFTSFSLYFSFF